ncbi:MAG: acetyl-CoA C-acetyltransferase [Chloroflexi bacterium]|nr:acetyl-CoA C-acetyltransferase [Chloroflexota bacterium]
MKDGIVILDGARTPFGSFLGSLKDVGATELGVIAAVAALERSRVDSSWIDQVIFGNVIQSSVDAAYLARHVGLKAGVPKETPAVTVNRLCGSGLEAIVQGAHRLLLDDAEFVLAGGTESMSQAPYSVFGARGGLRLGHHQLEDVLWGALTDSYNCLEMAESAELLAQRYEVAREEQDEYAYRSHMRAAQARSSGRFAQEIIPVTIIDKKGRTRVVKHDEHIRPDTSLQALAALPPRFRADGTVTPGNASGINDGAAAVVVTTERVAAQRDLKPLGRLVSWAVAGVDPDYMGIGPAPASRQALARAGLKLENIDLVEINEAFAGQYLSVEAELGLDRERTNVNGGAIALGHPLAASGARLALTLLYELRLRKKRYGLVSLCIGGGQGIAAVLENLQRRDSE